MEENNNSNNKKNKIPAKFRHDGSSPLPLGMDWSPPPKKWDGRDTVWPHDPHTGWSYCVMVPSWIVQPESGEFSGGLLNTVVFFRVLVGIQSPEGVSTSHVILRRFSDFLKLFSDVNRAFRTKNIPQAPAKNSLFKVNSSRSLLEERRRALEEWIGKLLSDIDLSRSALIATFLELEAAVRSSHNLNQHALETSTSDDGISGASLADSTGSSILLSAPSEFDSINGISRQGNVHISGFSTEDLGSAHALNAERKSSYNSILGEKLEELFRNELQHRKENLVLEKDNFCGKFSKASLLSGDHVEFTEERKQDRPFHHAGDMSTESIMTDISSNGGSELSNPSMSNSLGDGSVNLLYGAEAPIEAFDSMEMRCMNDVLVIHPVDQRHKLNKFLVTMNQRLVAAKTDMEDLIARLNQEIAIKEYLTAKVKDLEVELEMAKQKSKEDLQQAILLERERVTQIQWETDELRRNYMDIESKFKFVQREKAHLESGSAGFGGEKELLLQELDNKTEKLKDLQKSQEELEIKSKSDIRVLVKEVKFLRSSQAELKEVLNQSLKQKIELEQTLQKEKQRRRYIKLARKKLIYACEDLRHRLQESSVNFLAAGEDKFTVNPSSMSDSLGLLTTSDTRIRVLLAKAQLLAQDDGHGISDVDGIESSDFEFADTLTALNITDDPNTVSDDDMASEDEIKKMLSDTIIDSAILRKQINSVVRCALKTIIKPLKDDSGEAPPRKTVLNRFLRR